MINDHKPTTELTNRTSNNDSERGEWKMQHNCITLQLLMQNNCIFTKDFEETRTIYSASKPVEIFVGNDTNDTIDRLFYTLLQRFQQAIETSNERGSGFNHESIASLYYYFRKIEIRKAESYLASSDWLVNEGATINPKNKKNNKCFQYAITGALNHNKIKEKYLKKIEKIKQAITNF